MYPPLAVTLTIIKKNSVSVESAIMLASSIKIVTEPPNSTLTRGTTPQLKSFFPKLMTQALKHFNPLIYSFAIMHALTRGRTLRIQDYHLQTRDKLQLAGGVRNAERSITKALKAVSFALLSLGRGQRARRWCSKTPPEVSKAGLVARGITLRRGLRRRKKSWSVLARRNELCKCFGPV